MALANDDKAAHRSGRTHGSDRAALQLSASASRTTIDIAGQELVARFQGKMTWRSFLLGYVAILACGVGGGLASELYLGVPADRFLFAFGGALFLIAAAGQSRSLYFYRLVRNVGWFAAIEDDRTMRIVLLVLAVALFIGAAFSG